MSTRTIQTRIQLRRDSLENFEKIKDTFIPLKGEVLLVDTPSDGLRSKVGDGVKTFAQLQYSDQTVRDLITDIVVQGYYYNGNFYTTAEHTVVINPYSYKVYINLSDYDVYGYFDNLEAYHKLVDIPTASSSTAGIMKLYDTTGSNTDGTMTQNSICTAIGKKVMVTVGTDEDLIFTDGI